MPPSGALGLLLVLLVCSLLAGHVGNILSSMGRGDSLKYSCNKDSSADILLVGLYVKNLWEKEENEDIKLIWGHSFEILSAGLTLQTRRGKEIMYNTCNLTYYTCEAATKTLFCDVVGETVRWQTQRKNARRTLNLCSYIFKFVYWCSYKILYLTNTTAWLSVYQLDSIIIQNIQNKITCKVQTTCNFKTVLTYLKDQSQDPSGRYQNDFSNYCKGTLWSSFSWQLGAHYTLAKSFHWGCQAPEIKHNKNLIVLHYSDQRYISFTENNIPNT